MLFLQEPVKIPTGPKFSYFRRCEAEFSPFQLFLARFRQMEKCALLYLENFEIIEIKILIRKETGKGSKCYLMFLAYT